MFKQTYHLASLNITRDFQIPEISCYHIMSYRNITFYIKWIPYYIGTLLFLSLFSKLQQYLPRLFKEVCLPYDVTVIWYYVSQLFLAVQTIKFLS